MPRDVIHQLVGGVKAAMGYTGAATIAELQQKARVRPHHQCRPARKPCPRRDDHPRGAELSVALNGIGRGFALPSRRESVSLRGPGLLAGRPKQGIMMHDLFVRSGLSLALAACRARGCAERLQPRLRRDRRARQSASRRTRRSRSRRSPMCGETSRTEHEAALQRRCDAGATDATATVYLRAYDENGNTMVAYQGDAVLGHRAR